MVGRPQRSQQSCPSIRLAHQATQDRTAHHVNPAETDAGAVGSRFVPLRQAQPNRRQWDGIWFYTQPDLCAHFKVADPADIEINDNRGAIPMLDTLRPYGYKIISHTDKNVTCQKPGSIGRYTIDTDGVFFHWLFTT